MSKVFSIYDIADLNKNSLSNRDVYEYINYLDTSNLTKNKVNSIQLLKSNFPSRAKRKVKNNTILYSTVRPNQEHYGIVQNNNIENLIISTGFTTIDVVSKEVDPKYLFYKLTQPFITKHLHTIAENSVTSYPSIKPEDIGGLKFIFPDLLEQQKIASILSVLDYKIGTNNKINAELETMAKLIYDFWFVQFDFPDEDGRPYKSSGGKMMWNDELKREIPEGWKSTTLSKIANITMGQSPPGSSYNQDGIGTIFYQGSTDFGNRYPIIRQYTSSPSRLAKLGDILLSVRAPVGDMNIANHDCCIGRGLAALNSKIGAQGFLYEVMKYFKQVFDLRNGNGTTFGSITKDDLYSLPLAYPSDEVVMQFEEIVSPMYRKQNLIETQNQKLMELRDWLLPMLMNGQVKVKEN